MADDLWTPALVGRALVAAVRWGGLAAGAVGPKQFGSGLPIAVEPDDQPAGRSFSPAEVSRFEAALAWQSRYLGGLPGPARVLRVWVVCRVRRVPFAEVCRARRWSRMTAYRARDRALATIAQGLNRDGIPLFYA